MMTLQHAKTVFLRERLDWSRPRLNWIARALYGHRRRTS